MLDSFVQMLKTKHPELLAPIRFIDVEDGWFGIVWSLLDKIQVADPESVVLQIKEKFGVLRFYVKTSEAKHEEVMRLVNEAVDRSAKTCEFTGRPGQRRNVNQWIKTCCDDIYEKAQKVGWWEVAKTYREDCDEPARGVPKSFAG